MLTHLIKSTNWVDVALAFLFIRMIFVGIKNGFVSEFLKTLGLITAVFVSLHYYTYLAAWAAVKTHFIWAYWQLVIFGGLWLLVSFFFKFAIDGVLLLFKIETNHQGFDRYASGIIAVGRGLLVCSMTIFLLLLTCYAPVMRMTLHSISFKIAGRAAVGTYGFLYYSLIDKLFAGEHYNADAAKVLHPDEK